MNNIYDRIIKWNYERNSLKFDPDLEATMLAEEANEFMEAYMNYLDPTKLPYFKERIVTDMIDAYCDYYFVAVGTKAKITMNNTSFKYREATDLIRLIKEQLAFMYETIMNILGNDTYDIIYKSLMFVIEANEDKPNKKNGNGKVIKGDKWIDPKYRIEELLLLKGIKNV